MTQEELDIYCRRYLLNVLTYEEYRSMGLDSFRDYVKEHIIPIPKAELVVGQEYPGPLQERTQGHMGWKEISLRKI